MSSNCLFFMTRQSGKREGVNNSSSGQGRDRSNLGAKPGLTGWVDRSYQSRSGHGAAPLPHREARARPGTLLSAFPRGPRDDGNLGAP